LEASVTDNASLNAELDFMRISLRNRVDNLKRVLRGRRGEAFLPPRGEEPAGSEDSP
jgi:hypothetical protein